MMRPIVIVDYGMANLRSVQKAFERFGHPAEISGDANRVAEADKVVLPGVGAFRGWNALRIRRRAPELTDVAEGAAVYFVHSYHVVPRDSNLIATETNYPTPFTSAIWQDNVFATQFHPEKSQTVGLTMLRNFAALR
jgi:imidazoleglycerol phosphate synthase glutamine amidotransferase subunit HisH